MTRHISLMVDDFSIEMDYFVQGFIDHTVYGMISSFEEVGEINLIEIKIDRNSVKIDVNSNPLPINDFVAAITASTLRGIVSPLKGVENPEKIYLVIRR